MAAGDCSVDSYWTTIGNLFAAALPLMSLVGLSVIPLNCYWGRGYLWRPYAT